MQGILVLQLFYSRKANKELVTPCGQDLLIHALRPPIFRWDLSKAAETTARLLGRTVCGVDATSYNGSLLELLYLGFSPNHLPETAPPVKFTDGIHVGKPRITSQSSSYLMSRNI